MLSERNENKEETGKIEVYGNDYEYGTEKTCGQRMKLRSKKCEEGERE